MDANIFAHLESHEKVFEGLMSLTPAKIYYGEDNEDQWKRKKQSKEQRRAAKKAKLDPSANKSALDVYKDSERKRKRLDGDGEDESDVRSNSAKTIFKKQKGSANIEHHKQPGAQITKNGANESAKREAKADKRKAKRERMKAKKSKALAKADAQKIRKRQGGNETLKNTDADNHNINGAPAAELIDGNGLDDEKNLAMGTSFAEIENSHFDSISHDVEHESDPSTAPTSVSDTFGSAEAIQLHSKSAASRTDVPEVSEKDTQLRQERLRARIDALRAARNADGPDGRPARNRQELIEARRKKEEKRKLHKKEIRSQARQEQRLEEAEAEAARLRGGSFSPNLFSPTRATPENNFSFGKINFDNGKQLNSTLSALIDSKSRKGPQDPRSALEAAQRKLARVNGYDKEKREDIEEKDRWLQAKKRIHGEKVKDDVSLLKKTLKRKEKEKTRSGKEWDDRTEGVRKGLEMRQKKREENIQKRKDEKGNRGKKHAGKSGKKIVKKRPGFEGSFKASHKTKPA